MHLSTNFMYKGLWQSHKKHSIGHIPVNIKFQHFSFNLPTAIISILYRVFLNSSNTFLDYWHFGSLTVAVFYSEFFPQETENVPMHFLCCLFFVGKIYCALKVYYFTSNLLKLLKFLNWQRSFLRTRTARLTNRGNFFSRNWFTITVHL